MARRPRILAPHLLYHVIVRGNHRQKTFLREDDYHTYLQRLGAYRRKYAVAVYAYCLMPNHAHLLLQTTATPLSRFMQGLQQSYTQYFNRVHGKVGHLFQGRYKAIVCERDRYLVALIRYIHLNPVRARLVAQPDNYPYSGHGTYLSGRATDAIDPTEGLSCFGGRAAYRRFLQDEMPEGHQADYYTVVDQQVLGGEAFVKTVQTKLPEEPRRRIKKSLLRVVPELAASLRVDPRALRSPDRSWKLSRIRTLITYILTKRGGFGMGEVAAYVGRDPATLSTLLSRFSASFESDPEAQKIVGRLVKIVEI